MTLLEHQAEETFLPHGAAEKIGIIVGGPCNSGILATGAVLAFPLHFPAVASIIPGVANAVELGMPATNAAMEIPEPLWCELQGAWRRQDQ